MGSPPRLLPFDPLDPHLVLGKWVSILTFPCPRHGRPIRIVPPSVLCFRLYWSSFTFLASDKRKRGLRAFVDLTIPRIIVLPRRLYRVRISIISVVAPTSVRSGTGSDAIHFRPAHLVKTFNWVWRRTLPFGSEIRPGPYSLGDVR